MIDPDFFKNLIEADLEAIEEMVRDVSEAIGSVIEKSKNDNDGETCVKCKNLFPQSEPNQPDGTLICFSCRTFK